MRARKQLPKLCLHKASGQGFVTDPRLGREVYLGAYGSAECVRAYGQWCRDFAAGKAPAESAPAGGPRVAELLERHLAWARGYYVKHGRETSAVRGVRMACRAVLSVCDGTTPAEDFGPAMLKKVRQHLVDAELSRHTVNAVLGKVRAVWRWGVTEELVPAGVWQALLAVRGPGRGRGGRETDPVGPAAWADVDAAAGRLVEPWRSVVLLAWHAAMRPGEALAVVRGEVDASAEPWVYRPGSWKTEHHEGLRPREVFLGPRARGVLGAWLPGCAGPESFVFPGRRRGTHASRRGLADALAVACALAPAVPRFSPNQLRHGQATEVRKRYSIEAVQAVLGHASLDIAEVYGEKDRSLAARVMEELG